MGTNGKCEIRGEKETIIIEFVKCTCPYRGELNVPYTKGYKWTTGAKHETQASENRWYHGSSFILALEVYSLSNIIWNTPKSYE